MGAHGQCVFVCKPRSLLTNTTHLCCSEGSSRLGLDFQFHSARADPALGVLTEILNGLEHSCSQIQRIPWWVLLGLLSWVSAGGRGRILYSIIHRSVKILSEQAIILWKLRLIKSNTILTNALSYLVRTILYLFPVL